MANVSIPGGITAYRTELRRQGGLRAAGAAIVVAALGGVLLWLPGTLTGLVGFGLVVAACPLLVAFGVPISAGLSTIAMGLGSSFVLWFVVGQWAAHRATQRPVADWRDWWSVMWPLALAMVGGGFAGFLLFALGIV